jgi:hypothetical protein
MATAMLSHRHLVTEPRLHEQAITRFQKIANLFKARAIVVLLPDNTCRLYPPPVLAAQVLAEHPFHSLLADVDATPAGSGSGGVSGNGSSKPIHPAQHLHSDITYRLAFQTIRKSRTQQPRSAILAGRREHEVRVGAYEALRSATGRLPGGHAVQRGQQAVRGEAAVAPGSLKGLEHLAAFMAMTNSKGGGGSGGSLGCIPLQSGGEECCDYEDACRRDDASRIHRDCAVLTQERTASGPQLAHATGIPSSQSQGARVLRRASSLVEEEVEEAKDWMAEWERQVMKQVRQGQTRRQDMRGL